MSRTFTCDICGTHRWDTIENCPVCVNCNSDIEEKLKRIQKEIKDFTPYPDLNLVNLFEYEAHEWLFNNAQEFTGFKQELVNSLARKLKETYELGLKMGKD